MAGDLTSDAAPRPSALTTLLPIPALLGSMVSIHIGAALAQRLFPAVGAQGAAALRVALAALLLLALRRPSLASLTGPRGGVILLYGLALGAMNLTFYMALRTIPLGVAVAVEFTGPLALAALSHRSRLDILWLALAATGLIALTPLAGGRLDPIGLLLALGAGVFWALYILFGQKAGAADPGAATAWGMAVAALLAAPFGVAQAGAGLLDPALLPVAFSVAVLSSALPYTLEMFALTRLPRATFGTLMSLEPAVGAVAGYLMLGQVLSLRQGLAIALIILASGGAAASLVSDARRAGGAPMV
jgi:inner membrane transporter RhtA